MKPAIPALTLLLLTTNLRADPAVDKPLDASFLRLYSETRGFTLGRPVNIKPTPDGKHVLFLRSPAKSPKRSLFEFDVATGKTRELLTPEALLKGGEEQLTPEEKARRERMRVSAGGFADFHLDEAGKFILLPLSGKLFVFDRSTEKARELKIPAGTIQDPKWSRDGKKIAYVRDYDVYAYDLATDTETPVTKGGTEMKTHGLAEFVAQEEMSRFSGYWWSPDGKHIAYEEADHDGVETWYVADPSKPDQKPLHQFYPRPGKKNVSVRLGISPTAGGDTIWVDWDREKYEYLGAVKWDKHGPLTIQVQNRNQQNTRLLRVEPKTGKTAILWNEHDDAFTNLRQDIPRWVPNTGHRIGDDLSFIWYSEWEPGPSIELRGENGAVQEVLVRPDEMPTALIHGDALRQEVVYMASKNPTESHVYVRPMHVTLIRNPGSDKPVRLGEGEGHESVVFSENKDTYVLTSTSPGKMPRSVVHTRKNVVGELPSVGEEPGFVPKVEFEKVGGDNGFYAAIVRPRDFDPKKKYPVIVDVYGGPHSLTVAKAMRNWLIPQFQADQGFIVVSIDNRGTPGRGRDWERAIYTKFGSVPIEDQVKGLKLLGEKHPEMDLDRVGVTGWSFGGYMAALSVLKRPDIYKAAVAGAPVTDWQDYDTHYTERYMGLLPENQKEYDESSLLPLAPKLERPLLLVHGTADDNVFYRHTLRLTDALIRAGKDFEVMPLPGVTHMVSADPTVYERYMMRATAFFKKHLGEAK